MKSILLTLILIAASLTLMAQKKRYFKTTVEFETTNGCLRSETNTNYFTSYLANFDGTYQVIAKWIRPYKIKKGSFKITEIRQIDRAEFLTGRKSEKFQPCEDFNSNLFLADSIKFRYLAYPTWKTQSYFFGISGGEVLSVSSPDSTGIYTVKFSKSKVKFINDSAFTFKIK